MRRGCLKTQERSVRVGRGAALERGVWIRKRTGWNPNSFCDATELNVDPRFAPGREAFPARRNSEQLAILEYQRVS